MSVREINQRWLASMGLDDQSIALRNLIVNMPTGEQITGRPRPPWWRPRARARWDRSVELGRRLYLETASRMGVLVSP